MNCRRRKWHIKISKFSSTLWHLLHRLAVYNYRFNSKIPRTYTKMYFTHIGIKITGLKWSRKLITKIWKLNYRQRLHHSKLKHSGEALEYKPRNLSLTPKSNTNTAEAEIHYPTGTTHNLSHPSQPYYTPQPQHTKNWYLIIKTAQDTPITYKCTIFSSSKPLCTWLGIQPARSLPPST